MERTRAEALTVVIANLQEQAPNLKDELTVFDNASSYPGTLDALRTQFSNVYQASKNVGYWSAIDWWLNSMRTDQPDYTYIIE